MNINIEALDFKADKKLLDFAEKKVEKLAKFYDGIVSVGKILRWNSFSESKTSFGERGDKRK